MQVFVRNLEGASLTTEVAPTATVGAFKAQIAATQKIAGDFHLAHAGKIADDSSLVSECFTQDATIDVNLDLLGAGKKRKKKNYTKPKRIPHKHKKVKLAVLKFYKVDGNDKVQRLRKDCPNCGKGVFMAMHTINGNRYYCGKCTLTYVFKDGEKA